MAKVRVVHFDSQLLGMQEEHRREQIKWMEAGKPWRIDGPASPRWVGCKKCGAYRGDKCHTGRGYCPEREAANRERMLELETYAAQWKPPCHPEQPAHAWLCWRTTEDELRWDGVPCFFPGCGKTYQVVHHASDLVEARVRVDRINPQMVEMTCWATEEEDPWPKT